MYNSSLIKKMLSDHSQFSIRLYKASLIEEKYFQNEATNLEAKLLALEIAIHRDEKDLIDKCVDNLLATERNPVVNNAPNTTTTANASTITNDQPHYSVDSFIKIIFRNQGHR